MKLLEFPHSHYCEKARWALDYKGITFEAVAIMPGLHMRTVRKYAPHTYVPVLLDNNEVVQGSSEIINYVEQKQVLFPLNPAGADELRECLELERSMDKRLGENIRQVLYSRLLAYPDFIRHCFTHPMNRSRQIVFSLFYPILRNKIYKTYVVSSAQVEQAKHEFDVAVCELENRLKQRQYLLGEQFTRADLSVASMLSLLVMPPEHPFPWQEIPDQQTKTFFETFQDHPVSDWVRKMYRDHRLRETEHPS
ncbi:MAG: glutathione S-transferase family protein [Gammaproteobacteria bacterium]|nr:glutathione S-transferase family protein [Gammaproteobacteria bacterium]